MSPRSETNSPYSNENTGSLRLQQIQGFKHEIKVEDVETYTTLDFPVDSEVGHEYGEELNLTCGANGDVIPPPDGEQSCFHYIAPVPGNPTCVYGTNEPLSVSSLYSNDQSQMLPPICSISKHFQVQNEANMNARNLSSSSVSTRRSSAKSSNTRGGRRHSSVSPLGDGVVDLTSLIRCSPTSLLGLSSSSCSQVSNLIPYCQ